MFAYTLFVCEMSDSKVPTNGKKNDNNIVEAKVVQASKKPRKAIFRVSKQQTFSEKQIQQPTNQIHLSCKRSSFRVIQQLPREYPKVKKDIEMIQKATPTQSFQLQSTSRLVLQSNTVQDNKESYTPYHEFKIDTNNK